MNTNSGAFAVTALIAIGLGIVGYIAGSKKEEKKQAQKRDKIVNEIKAEREELLRQLVDKEKKNRKLMFESETQKLREENRLLRQQISLPTQDVFVFYYNDTDPLAQMVWIALLEKRIRFDSKLVNTYNKNLESTQKFLAVNPDGSIPFGCHGKIKLSNAQDICWYIEEEFPEPRLVPEDAIEKYKMRAVIEGHKSITTLWWALLTELDDKKRPELSKKLEDAIKAFNKDIVGPYIMGESFTLADIFYLPIFERIDVVIGHFRNFTVPADCGQVIRWLKVCHERTSFKTTTERTEESVQALPWSEKERTLYLREVYEAVAVGRWPEITAALAKTDTPLTAEQRKVIIYKQPQQV